MAIWDQLINYLAVKAGYIKPGQTPAWLSAYADASRYTIPDGSLYHNQAELYQRNAWVNIAIGVVAGIVATTPINVKRRVGEELEDIPNHPFEVMLQEPNPLESRFELVEALWAFRKLCGNSYWWLNKANEDAPPDEVWTLEPERIEAVPDKRMFIKGYLYDPGAPPKIPLEPWEVVHFRAFHPLSKFVGLSSVEPVAVDASSDEQMAKWNNRLFGENNARLPGILAFADPINDTDWNAIKKDAKDSANMRRHMMLRNVGKGGVQWLQAVATMKDMEFMAGRQFTKEEIWAVFAPGLSSMLAINANEASGRVGYKTLIDVCVWPALCAIAEKITNNVLPAYGDNLVAEFDDIRVTDRLLELQEMSAYSRVHTVDEIRKEHYGDDPIGDERGDLLPAQIGQSAVLEPGMETNEEDDGGGSPFGKPQGNAPEVPGQEERDADDDLEAEVKAAHLVQISPLKADLLTWQRKALTRGPGKMVPFDSPPSPYIPAALYGSVLGSLEATTTTDEIRAVFTNAMIWGEYP